MRFEILKETFSEIASDGLVLFVTKGNETVQCTDMLGDDSLIYTATKLIESRKYVADFGSVLAFEIILGGRLLNVLLVGMGEAEKIGFREVLYASGTAARKSTELHVGNCSVLAPNIATVSHADICRAIVMGFKLGIYQFDRYKTVSSSKPELDLVRLHLPCSWEITEAETGSALADAVSDAVCLARDLANEPSNIVTPTYLAEVAQKVAEKHGLEIEVWDREKIAAEKFGLLSAVSRGSRQEPRFIRLTYRHPDATQTIALVGKGITFDTGGYSLKPAGSMESMKDDMSGAADVLSALDCLGALKPKVNIHVLIPATENCIGGSAIHPGDIFTAYSGKSVEINNTDAEGRLILADAVAYARSLDSDMIVDLATLTGACVVAIGTHISGIMSNDDGLAESLLDAAGKSGEKLCRLPLDRDYMDEIKSSIADLKNCGGRQAGVIVGGLFIGEFAEDTKWAHIDLSSATLDGDTAIARKGSSGAVVATLVQFVLDNEPKA